MSLRVTLSEAEGVPVACKTLLDGAGPTGRLAIEAANLASVRHPGVVRLVSWDGQTLTTEFAGPPVRQIVTVPTELAAAIVATVAHTVADLHDAGLVHGAVEVSHVLVGHGSHPRLCSLGGLVLATPSGELDDVAGLGRVLRHLVGDVGEGDPIPEHRRLLRRPGHGTPSYERRGLLTIADQATADVPGQRPTARRLAQMIADMVPTATVVRSEDARIGIPTHLTRSTSAAPDPAAEPATPEPPTDLLDVPFPHPALRGLVVPDTPAALFGEVLAPTPPIASAPVTLPARGGRREPMADQAEEPAWPGDDEAAPTGPPASSGPARGRAMAAVVAAAIGVVLLVAGAAGLIRRPSEQVSTASRAPAAVEPGSTTAGPPEPATTSTTEPVASPTSLPVCGEVGAPDLDDDGCGDEMHVDGTIVTVGAARFQVGSTGDVVTVGDWDCDGLATPALLRPGTGDVFVFTDWTETQVTVEPIDRVPDGATITPDADAVGCDRLVVTDTDGRRTAIEAR